jgi:hypothetical protein
VNQQKTKKYVLEKELTKQWPNDPDFQPFCPQREIKALTG